MGQDGRAEIGERDENARMFVRAVTNGLHVRYSRSISVKHCLINTQKCDFSKIASGSARVRCG